MVVIFEGPDRCSKSTQAEKLLSVMHDLPVHVIHYSSPKGFKNTEEAKAWLTAQYTSMFEMLEAFQGKADFILDRSHVSEMVYAPMYRGYTGDYVLDIERAARDRNPAFWDSIRLVTFYDKPDNLIAREDGLSFTTDRVKKAEEVIAFLEATSKSQISRKTTINIDGLDVNEVFERVKAFVFSDVRHP